MRKIKRREKPKKNINKNNNIEDIFTKRTKIVLAVAAVFIIISAVLFYIEDTDCKIVIKNSTDMKLEYVEAYYVGPEDKYNDGINETDIEAGKKIVLPQDPINLSGAEANLEIRFKFENHEALFVDAGIFNENFNGKVTIAFKSDKNGKVKLNVKAASGVISSSRINCDDTFTINLNDNMIED